MKEYIFIIIVFWGAFFIGVLAERRQERKKRDYIQLWSYRSDSAHYYMEYSGDTLKVLAIHHGNKLKQLIDYKHEHH